MVSWEYKVFETDKSFWGAKDKIDIDNTLDELGRDGWELISVVPLSTTSGSTTGLQFF
ncbi:MAG: DUF4177 domain-containing protein [Thermoplasmatales archaeon]|nr:MAG: DUF4177 domain-containing protein [Thermoplasmatales archaeon]